MTQSKKIAAEQTTHNQGADSQATLSFDAALERWLANIKRLDPEVVSLDKSLGRTLATDLYSDIDVSPFDNSAMDGFALHANDSATASPADPAELEVITTIAAGDYFEGKLSQGQTARIMTGAPVPKGANTVVKVEDVSVRTEDDVTYLCLTEPVSKGLNIRLAGEEIKAGECVLKRGNLIGPAAIGLLAATGHARVPVYRLPIVGIISTGEELIPVEELPTGGKIRNTNSHSLAAQAQVAGGKVRQYENISDTLDACIAAFTQAVAECDIVISSGGVSVGDFDFVEKAVRSLGDLQFASVKMRPGKPQTTGMIGDTPFFGLPGNPASAYLGFELFIRPAILKMAGHTQLQRPVQQAVLAHDIKKRQGLRYFMRGRLGSCDGSKDCACGGKLADSELRRCVQLSGNQSSALLSSLHKGNCLLVLPEEETLVKAGSIIDCIRLDIAEGTEL